MYRVFFSYASSLAGFTCRVAEEFSRPGLAAFVAPRDIPPAAEWQQASAKELLRCNALAAFISADFRGSEWCDQEVGYALGREKPVIPLILPGGPSAPHGFLSRLQAVNVTGLDEEQVADRIFDCLFDDPRGRHELLPTVVQAVSDERQVVSLRRWAERLAKGSSLLTDKQRSGVAKTLRENSVLRTDRAAYSIVEKAISTTDAGSNQ